MLCLQFDTAEGVGGKGANTKKHIYNLGSLMVFPTNVPKNPKATELIIIPQKFSHKNESSEPHVRLRSLRVWQQEEEEHPENVVLKANGV